MPNQHIHERLAGIQEILVGAHKAGGPLSAASKGSEREYFINNFLSRVFPPPHRFGHGDATDSDGRRSGQLDVVVEYPFLPSLPIVGSDSSRLYLAEGVGAVIEVKSDVSKQWPDVMSANWPAAAMDSVLILSFWPEQAGGRIELVHVNVPDDDFAGISHGWEKYYWTPVAGASWWGDTPVGGFVTPLPPPAARRQRLSRSGSARAPAG